MGGMVVQQVGGPAPPGPRGGGPGPGGARRVARRQAPPPQEGSSHTQTQVHLHLHLTFFSNPTCTSISIATQAQAGAHHLCLDLPWRSSLRGLLLHHLQVRHHPGVDIRQTTRKDWYRLFDYFGRHICNSRGNNTLGSKVRVNLAEIVRQEVKRR